MRLVGLTGGIASGKSTVARMFAELGAPVIDADLLAREVLAPGTPGLAEVARRWPQVMKEGQLDRKALGAVVFADAAQRAELNAITHPRIAAEAMRRTAALADQGAPAALYEAALIVENNLDRGLDGLIVVSVPPALQLERLMAREGLSEREARVRLEAQAPLEEKVRRATWVIDNGGERELTRARVGEVWRAVLAGEGKR
jgi:dephospho-CoA kinase